MERKKISDRMAFSSDHQIEEKSLPSDVRASQGREQQKIRKKSLGW